MSTDIKKIILFIIKLLDIFLAPLTLLASIWFKFIRRININRMHFSKYIFNKIGLLPISDHYYEPLINPEKYLNKTFSKDRVVTGINLNSTNQLKLLKKFNFQDELLNIPLKKQSNLQEFYYNNHSFEYGDSEFLYSIIRELKPKKIIEIGSGFSTRMSLLALNKNKADNPQYSYEFSCIEPYEFHLISLLNVTHIKEKVEDIDIEFFKSLNENDILFIDSSHIIRPNGDVLYEIQNILPILKKGVIIHIHDIFTPNHYPYNWLKNHILWNEQYLVEALLTDNENYEIIGALNYLKHNFWNEISSKLPVLAKNKDAEPGSFWIRKV